MGNRVIQAKIFKMKRQRRAWAKRFSMKNAGPMSNPVYINEKGKPTSISVGARSKSARVLDLDSQLNIFLRRKFKFKASDPESIYARNRGLHTDLTRDNELILARMVQSKSGAGTVQGEERFVQHVCVSRETCRRVLFMSGETNFFIEARVTKEGTAFLRSYTYNRTMALLAHKNDDILWEEIILPKADTDS